MIDEAGRVRVLDFGLSRAEPSGDVEPASSSDVWHVTAAGSLIGTPAYMSPEQHRRETADARSDQFAFCVSLWEALHGLRPFAGVTRQEIARNVTAGRMNEQARNNEVPPWISRILERGLAADPDQRWPSMDALLAALANDPRRTRKRWVASIVGIAGIAGAGYGLAVYQGAQAQVCSRSADDLIGIWDDTRREELTRTLAAIDVPYAGRALAATVRHLDAFAGGWIAAEQGSCEAHRRGRLSSGLFDRRMTCLRQRKAQLAATVEVLSQTTRDNVANVVDTATGLQGVEACEDDARLLADVPLPAEPERAAAVEAARERLARAQARERGGRYTEALALLTPMISEADALGYLPYMAEVHLLAGKLYTYTGQVAQASIHLDLALRQGLEGKVDMTAAEALAIEVFVLGAVARRPAEALARAPLAWSLVRRTGGSPRLSALLHNNVAAAHSELGDASKSVAEFKESLALLVEHVPDDPLRWAVVNNLGLDLLWIGEHEQARMLAQDALRQLEVNYDPCYPVAASLRMVLASSRLAAGDFSAARVDVERALACFGDDYPPNAIDAIGHLASISYLTGDHVEARRQLERGEALAARYPESIAVTMRLALTHVDLDLHAGDLAAARRRLEDLQARAEASAGPERLIRFEIDARLGLLAHREGDDVAALQHLERAAAQLKLGIWPMDRGLYRFTHARVLHALGRERETVMAQVELALESYRAAGPGYAVHVAEIEDWLAAHPELRAP